MGWSIGYDSRWDRDIGYGVPAYCDHPGCGAEIDRGLSHVCGGEPYGGDMGCGLYFCDEHLSYRIGVNEKIISPPLCDRCFDSTDDNLLEPFEPSHERQGWIYWKLYHFSWKEWRKENPTKVREYRARLRELLNCD